MILKLHFSHKESECEMIHKKAKKWLKQQQHAKEVQEEVESMQIEMDDE